MFLFESYLFLFQTLRRSVRVESLKITYDSQPIRSYNENESLQGYKL